MCVIARWSCGIQYSTLLEKILGHIEISLQPINEYSLKNVHHPATFSFKVGTVHSTNILPLQLCQDTDLFTPGTPSGR